MARSVNIKKKIFLITLVGVFLGATVFAVVRAQTDPGQIETTSSSQSTSSELTPEEVNKILADIKVSGNDGNIEAQMDELIQRALLTGNITLKEYAEYTKQAYQLQSQLDTVNASIEALCAKSPQIKQLNDQVKESTKADVSVSEVKDTLPSGAASVLSNLSEKDMASLAPALAGIPNMESIAADPSSASSVDQNIMAIVLLQEAIDQGLLKDDQVTAANDAISSAAASLSSAERGKYTSAEHNALKATSEEFAKTGNKSKSALPEQVVMANTSFKLKNAAIMYDEQLLISLNDVLQFINAKVQYTENNGTMAIQSKDKIVEITSGKNVGYVNDKPLSIPSPVLTVNGITYLSVEFFAQAYDISYINLSDQGVLVMYANLNQTAE